jgi:hypothetical protein
LVSVPGQATSGNGWHWDPRGWLKVDTPGAVVEGVDVSSTIDVSAPDVTIKNSKITNATGQTAAEHSSVGIKVDNGANNVTVEDTEIFGQDGGINRMEVGIQAQWAVTGLRVAGVDIHHMTTGVQTDQGVVQDSYIHDFGFFDWGAPDGPDHLNGVTSNSSNGPLLVRHNTILNSFQQTDAISLFEDFGPQANATIDGNLLAGGGWTIYGGDGDRAPTSNVVITNNRISRLYFPTGGYWGWIAKFTRTNSGNVLAGNVWDDSGLPAT